jgi:DUF3047 family protein
MMRQGLRLIVVAAVLAYGRPAAAEMLEFGPDLGEAGWSIVGFAGVPPASFRAADRKTLRVSTDASAGMLWRRVDEPLRKASAALWRWRVSEGVVPTDLSKRGADDRALAVYFVFGAAADFTRGPLALLGSPSVTVLVYVFGGDKPRGAIVPSPHMGKRGKFIVLRPADAQKGAWFDENVDLAQDYARAFGVQSPLLLAVAISSDSDDTRGRNRAELRDLVVGR